MSAYRDPLSRDPPISRRNVLRELIVRSRLGGTLISALIPKTQRDDVA